MSVAERLGSLAAPILAWLPPALLYRLSGEPPVTIDGQTLDPQLQLIRAVRRRQGVPGYCEPTVPLARARHRREAALFTRTRTSVATVRDFTIPGEAGPIPVRHYAPRGTGEAPAPLLVYLHGGGFAVCDLDTHDEACRILCRHAGTHVLSVDYRLAPEHPFPAGLHDTETALRWAQAHAASLGADPACISIGGDSAGGNLATVAARRATRAGTPPVAQLLIYPATDAVIPRPSHSLFGQGFFLDGRDVTAFARYYAGGSGIDPRDPLLSPLYAPDLDGLPPALVVTAGFDVLRDEGEAYVKALRAAGTTVRSRRFPSLGHIFINLTGVCQAAHDATVHIAADWKTLLEETSGCPTISPTKSS